MIIINAYHNFIFKGHSNYYIFNIWLLENYDKEENLVVSEAATSSCFKRNLLSVFYNVDIRPTTAWAAPQW